MNDPLNPELQTWLALIEWKSDPGSTRFGSAQPVAYLSESAGSWRRPQEPLERLFPDRGKIFWWDLPSGVDVNSVVCVELERHPSYEPGTNREAFQVKDHGWDFAYEVRDLRKWENERNLRLALAGDGIEFRLTAPHVYLRLGDEEAVGPLTLEQTAPNCWKAPESELEHLDVWRLTDEHCSWISVDGRHTCFLNDPSALGPPIGIRNWSPDAKLAAGVLGRLWKLDRETARALSVTKDVFRTYVERYDDFLFESDLQRRQEAARFQRVEELLDVVVANDDLLRRAADALLNHPDVQEALEERKRQAVEEEREKARAALQSELSEWNEKVENAEESLIDLKERVAEREQDLDDLDARVGSRREEVEEELGTIEAELEQRLSELAKKPADLFVQSAILKALAANDAAPASTPLAPQDAKEDHSETQSGQNRPQPQDLPDAGRATSELARHFMKLGFPPTHAASLVAAFRSRRAVVAAGAPAYDVLRAFADTFAGGRITWIPVSPSTSDSADLLGRQESATGRFIAHPGGLLNVLRGAERDERLHLVVLDGFDRAPAEHYLTPLLQCYVDAASPDDPRAIPISVGPGEALRVAWPPNVLLACVPESGPSALLSGASLWRHAVLFDAEGEAKRARPDAEGARETRSQISKGAWDAARLSDSTLETAARETKPLLDASPARPSSLVTNVLRLYAAATEERLEDDQAKIDAFIGAVLPHFRDPEDLRRAISTTFPSIASSLAPRAEALLSYVRPTTY